MPRRHDALVSAKIALIGADRSLDALVVMPADDDDPRLGLLQAQLLRREVEARFPDARGVVRVGLDCAPNAVDSAPAEGVVSGRWR